MSNKVRYAELEDMHRASDDSRFCSCGANLRPPDWLLQLDPVDALAEAHRNHIFAVRQSWMSNHGFVAPEVMWAMCAYCGAIIGLLDTHREMCP